MSLLSVGLFMRKLKIKRCGRGHRIHEGVRARVTPLNEISSLCHLEQRLLLTGSLNIVTSANVSSAAHGGTVTYRFDVTFTPGSGGGDPTSASGASLSVINNTCTPVNPVTSGGFNVGDADTDNRLDSNEAWQFNCIHTVPAHSNSETDPINTTGLVSGNDSNGAAAASGISNTVAVDITHPAGTLAVTKSSNVSTVVHGGSITYRFDVSYTPGADGAPAKSIAVVDAKCAATATLSTGDVNANNLLDSGETWRFTCTHAVGASHSNSEQDPILNSAVISGQDFDGDALTPILSNQVSVDILHGSISGTKFLDIDGNGLHGPEEPNLQGWTINLFRDANSNGTFESGTDTQVDSQLTDSSGAFTFSNLVPGTYFVRESVQAGFSQTTANPAAIVITSNETAGGVVFGNEPPTSSIISDPCDSTKTALLIVGTSGNDTVKITRRSDSEVFVKVGKTTLGPYSPTGRIIVYGLGGNDKIQVSEEITLPMLVRAGAGNDTVFGANGDDVLIGGTGNDRLTGRFGRDILIGGAGEDRLLGSRDDDILVAGTTDYDANDEALCAILDEWRSSRDYAERLTNIRGTGLGPRENGSFFLSAILGTVDDDAAVDRVTGGGDGLDWFLVRLTGGSADRLADKVPAELIDEI